MDFQTAVIAVLGAVPEDYMAGSRAMTGGMDRNTDDNSEKILQMPEKDVNNDVVRTYLFSRGIDKSVTDYFISTGIIYQDRKYKSV
jgi:hypothetical protein